MNRSKRVDRLIDVYYKGGFFSDYKLILVGVGELQHELFKQCQQYGIQDEVIFIGWQDNVYKWMKNSELLISTSDYEGFPMNLIEALACNTKVVCTDCEFGPREILTGEFSRYLVPLNDNGKMIEVIKEALISYPDFPERLVENLDVGNVANQYIQTAKKWLYGKI